MDTNDFLGSVAQEDVAFTTRIVRTSQVGDNFWKVMIFVESDRFVDASAAGWALIPGSSTIKALTVTANDYAEHTTGVLRSWLYDLFCNGFSGDCILVACAPHSTGDTVYVYSTDGINFFTDAEMSIPAEIPAGVTPVATGVTNQYSYQTDPSADNFNQAMETAYLKLKAYAYHKTACIGATGFDADMTAALSLKCNATYDDKMLSSLPYVQYTISAYAADKGAQKAAITGSAEYTTCTAGDADAFMAVHADASKNAALFSLGLALGYINGTGYRVGNPMEMTKTGNISASGLNGEAMPRPNREAFEELYIQTYKPVGDNSGYVAGYGEKSLKGEDVVARWVVGYISYMSKVRIAQMITSPGFRKSEVNYKRIVFTMSDIVNTFSLDNGGCLGNVTITAPAYNQLPPAKNDEIIIEDAWSATFMGVIHNVDITGNLYIGE